jgi:MFS-type transporter involved in bile tolerance (Atg22 family)
MEFCEKKYILFQANMGNIREIRSYLESTRAENIANFSSALITAFEILHKVSTLVKYILASGIYCDGFGGILRCSVVLRGLGLRRFQSIK